VATKILPVDLLQATLLPTLKVLLLVILLLSTPEDLLLVILLEVLRYQAIPTEDNRAILPEEDILLEVHHQIILSEEDIPLHQIILEEELDLLYHRGYHREQLHQDTEILLLLRGPSSLQPELEPKQKLRFSAKTADYSIKKVITFLLLVRGRRG